MTQPTNLFWKELAEASAKDAHLNYFPSRRGSWPVEIDKDTDVLVLYNNNPYDRDAQLREKETAEIRVALKAAGIEELAYAVYPETGDGAGYTYAMVLQAGEDRQDEVKGIVMTAVGESSRLLIAAARRLTAAAAN